MCVSYSCDQLGESDVGPKHLNYGTKHLLLHVIFKV